METLWLSLGKIGDNLSLLPCLQSEHVKTGIKPNLMIAKEYAGMLSRIDYVNPVLYSGHWQDLKGALVHAKERYSTVICPQIYGRNFPIQHRHPSWQYDQWDRAGYLDQWDTLPLTVNRPSNAQEIASKYIQGPTILFADHSQSSPFFHKEEMYKLLVDHFGAAHKILRLSEVRMAHPLDLLALFDAAQCLVTVESMPLHLSKASTIPTVAMVADMPSPWNGSAYSKKFRLHCRYSDFRDRRDEIIDAVKACLNNSPKVKIEPLETPRKHGFNPAILRHGDKLVITYRYHPSASWKTRMATIEGDIEFPVAMKDDAPEDMRLFEHKGKLMASYVRSRAVNGFFKCVVEYGPLVKNGTGYMLDSPQRIIRPPNDFTGMVKNLVFFESDEKLFCIWGIEKDSQVVLYVMQDKVLSEHRSPAPTWKWGQIRGGAIVEHKGKLLRFFHSRSGTDKKHGDFRYHIGALLMEAKPPFTVLSVSKKPILSGNEEYTPHCFHWKRNCALLFGAIKEGGRFKVSCGINDSKCVVLDLGEEDLNL